MKKGGIRDDHIDLPPERPNPLINRTKNYEFQVPVFRVTGTGNSDIYRRFFGRYAVRRACGCETAPHDASLLPVGLISYPLPHDFQGFVDHDEGMRVQPADHLL